VHATQSPPFIVKFVLQVVQKVELKQVLQLDGQLTQTFEEFSIVPLAQTLQAVALRQVRQLFGQEIQVLPVKKNPERQERHPPELQVAQGDEQEMQRLLELSW